MAALDEGALRDGGPSDVPCGSCTGCCRSSQFVHIGPDETDTLDHVPSELLFPAPRMPAGHVLLGYDAEGRCPMLVDDGCSIYEHRPRTCRTYDCRVFAATGIEVGPDKALIEAQVGRWRFEHPGTGDLVLHDAVRAAAEFLAGNRELAADGLVPTSPTQLAVLAVELHGAFVGGADTGEPMAVEPGIDEVRVALSGLAARRSP